MAEPGFDVAVLGAGIAGAALAEHLGRRSMRAVVLDPRTPAAGASGRAAGIVTEQLWNDWDVRVTRESREEYRSLAAHGEPGAYLDAPFVRLTGDPAIADALGAAIHQLRGWGVSVDDVPVERLADWFPGGRFDGVRRAIASPTDACVTPSRITELYVAAARDRGAEFALGSPLEIPEFGGTGWNLRAGGREYRARSLVVAAGAWSKRLLASLDAPLPLTPYRTQAALLRPTTPPSRARGVSMHDLDTDVYARPEGNGRILAGDGTEKFEADPETFNQGADGAFLAHLAESLDRWFPDWAAGEVVGAWAGVCTSTPDRRPCIGPVDASRALYAMTGFNGFGVMRAGGAARRLAELLAEPASPGARAELAPVLPERFGGKSDSFPPRPGFTLEAGDAPRF